MTFEQWLRQIGKSERTAKSYSGAVSGKITEWACDAGLLSQSLLDIQSVQQFKDTAKQIKTLTIFQQRNTKGKNMYGAALNQYAAYLDDVSNETISTDIENVLNNKAIDQTEKSALINARVGQGKFRKQLIDHWRCCALSGFCDTRFLVASHIKPWKVASHAERLDCFNGLLLLPNLDKVFDLGFITFEESGELVISKKIEDTNRLGLEYDMHVNLDPAHQGYMDYHREFVFEKRFSD